MVKKIFEWLKTEIENRPVKFVMVGGALSYALGMTTLATTSDLQGTILAFDLQPSLRLSILVASLSLQPVLFVPSLQHLLSLPLSLFVLSLQQLPSLRHYP